MAQHDYTIANQGFPATRADINNALLAISSNNSGTSAPSTQYAGQFWLDTNTPSSTTWTLYIHDGSDDIQFATIDTSANTVNFIDSALASDVVINTSGAITTTGAFTSVGIDDNATSTAITIDSSENVGIGTAVPDNSLHVAYTDSTSYSNSTNDSGIQIENSNGTDNTFSQLHFRTGNADSYIRNIKTGTNLSSLVFLTDDGGTTGDVGEAIRIDSSGNIGIGTSSPVSKVNIEATKEAALSSAGMFLGLGLTVDDTTAYNTAGGVGGGITFRGKRNSSGTQTVYGAIVGTKNGTTNDEYNGNLRFFTNNNTNGIPTEHMRINKSGNIQIGTTTESARLHIASSTTAGTDPLVVFSDASGTDCGSIDINASANTVAYTTSSDHRLKENVDYNFDATTRIKQLKPARFNFIADADTTVDGFLAHEVSSVVPEAITGTHNELEVWKDGEELPDGVSIGDNKLDDNGNTIPKYQGIDQSKLVPLLVKTIQELEARITALETTTP